MKYDPLIPGNFSAADDLFDLGKLLNNTGNCTCDDCIKENKRIKKTYKEDILELAQAWFDLSKTNVGVVFGGFLEEWDEERCSQECLQRGIKLNQ